MDRNNRRHASPFAVRVSIRPIALQRTSGRCHRERSATNANRSVSAKTEAPAADDLGPGILDHSSQRGVRLATSSDLHPGRHRRPLASRTVPEVLDQVVPAASPSPSAPCRVSCAGSAGRLIRRGGPFCTTMSANWYQSISLRYRPSQ
jgi:hypothetical protein